MNGTFSVGICDYGQDIVLTDQRKRNTLTSPRGIVFMLLGRNGFERAHLRVLLGAYEDIVSSIQRIN